MKKLALLILCFCQAALAADFRITATVTVTNLPAAGNTITVNADPARTWVTNVVTPATQILIPTNSAVGSAATNLWLEIAQHAFSGPIIAQWQNPASNTNVITLIGALDQTMAVAINTNWASVSYSTQTVTAMYTVRVPGSGETASVRTNIFTLLVTAIDSYAQNKFTAGTTALLNYVDNASNQTNGGNKTWSGNARFNGAVTLNSGTVDVVGGTVITLENGTSLTLASNGTVNLGANSTMSFASGSKVSSFSGLNTTNWDFEYVADSNTVARLGDVTNFWTSRLAGNSSWSSTNNFKSAVVTNLFVVNFGWPVTGLVANSTVLQGPTSIQGPLSSGWNTNNSLAAGVNQDVNLGATGNGILSGGPAGGFSIDGFAPSLIADGELLTVWNQTSQVLTIANESGAEATPSRRILTLTGANVVGTTNCIFSFKYSSFASRWLLTSHQP